MELKNITRITAIVVIAVFGWILTKDFVNEGSKGAAVMTVILAVSLIFSYVNDILDSFNDHLR